MSRMYKHITVLALTLVTAASCLLSGCSLAKESTDSDSDDLLVGVYVIPHEAGDIIDLTEYADEENGDKIYAEIDKHGSDYSVDWTYSFPDMKGFMFLETVGYDETQESCATTDSDPVFSDVAYSESDIDDKHVIEISATLHYNLDNYFDTGELAEFDENKNDTDYFVYSYYCIYEDSDCSVYMSAEGCGATSVGPASGNSSSTQRVSTTTTKNGKSVTEERAVTISYKEESLPEQAKVLQMSADHRVLKETTIDYNKIPDSLKAVQDMAYIIVESSHQNSEGKTITDRCVYDRDDADGEDLLELDVYTPEDYGLLKNNVIGVEL